MKTGPTEVCNCVDSSVLEDPSIDDYDDGDLSDEEETLLMGGEGFSVEELAAAEARFTQILVCILLFP